MSENPIATLQIDLDSVWAIRRCYGLEGDPADEDEIYSEGIERFLELLDELGVKATFFVIGMDTEIDWKVEKLKQIVEAGHELGNHSYTHTLDLASKTGPELEAEIALAHKRIFQRTGYHPRGFKAPGYSISPELILSLDERGYFYDASLFPTGWGWVMRGLTRWMSKGKSSPTQYGGRWEGEKRQDPFVAGEFRGLIEMPVAVSAKWGLPFHSSVAMTLGNRYFRNCLENYRTTEYPLNYTLHGVDLCEVGAKELTGKGRGSIFFNQDLKKRVEFIKECLNLINEKYRILSVISAVEELRRKLGATAP